jgi:arginine exporter protein ArgO
MVCKNQTKNHINMAFDLGAMAIFILHQGGEGGEGVPVVLSCLVCYYFFFSFSLSLSLYLA